jgi:c-di-GMP-binding flagellar brake protein YcgR
MPSRNRRLGFRVPFELFINQYVNDRPFRALTTNISDSGIYLNLIKGSPFCRDSRVVGLEFLLPETGETIWARGEICYDNIDQYFHGTGVKFTAMPRVHARMLRDFCVEKRRSQLGNLLQKIRRPVPELAAV